MPSAPLKIGLVNWCVGRLLLALSLKANLHSYLYANPFPNISSGTCSYLKNPSLALPLEKEGDILL